MRLLIRFIVFVAISWVTILVSTAIFLPALAKLNFLGIASELPEIANVRQSYSLCAYTPNEDQILAVEHVSVRVGGIAMPLDLVPPSSATHGQEEGTGIQIACYNLGSFIAPSSGRLQVDLSPKLPEPFKVGVYTGRWKIPVVILGIISVGLAVAILLWRFVVNWYERRLKIA